MKSPLDFKRKRLFLLLIVLSSLFWSVSTRAAPVDAREAVAVASLWLQMEIGSPYLKLNAEEQTDRLNQLINPQVFYLLADDQVVEFLPPGALVLGYVVAYPQGGFVVLTADDRLDPVLVFDTNAPFRVDHQEDNFLRDFLKSNLAARWNHLQAQLAAGAVVAAHPKWLDLRARLATAAPGSDRDTPTAIYVLWDTALWDQGWPYNTEVVAHNGGRTGVPTGCVATAIAIKMRFHSWPPVGNGSRTYRDDAGLGYTHSANFGATTYNWANMPAGSLTQLNQDVATLMYHAGISVFMHYNVGNSWAFASHIVPDMNTFFRYRGTQRRTSGHEASMIASIRGGLPVIVGNSGHALVASGYRDSPSPYFYLNAGWSGSNNGWYNLDRVPDTGSGSPIDESFPYSSPDNYVYVDGSWSGTKDGTLPNPYTTVSEGNNAVPWGGQLWIRAGAYTGSASVPVTFNKAMTITSYQGTVTIGP